MQVRNCRSWDQLKQIVVGNEPFILTSAQTSTVIPYDSLEKELNGPCCPSQLVQTGALPTFIEVDEQSLLHISGPVTWKEAKAYCRQNGVTLKTYPTEELAFIPGGVATSATGERCFSFGTLRSQVVELTFIDYQGHEVTLNRDMSLKNFLQDPLADRLIDKYAQSYAQYLGFKNAPFPRFETATDLMIGTEGHKV